MIPAPGYGLHRHDNLVFLHERAGARCLNARLEGLTSPFQIVAPRWLICPHQLGQPEPGPILDHPFVRAMSPDQDGGLYHVRPQDQAWLYRLVRMTPSTGRIIESLLGLRRPKAQRVVPLLTLTNAAPQVLTDLEPSDLVEMETLAALPRSRNLILSGPIKLPGATLLTPEGLDPDHDWAAEGRRQLHHLVRRVL